MVLSLQGLEGGSLPLHLISHLRLVEGQWFLKTNLCFTDICCNEVSHLACYFIFPLLGQLCSILQCCHFWSPSDGEYLCVSPKCRNLWSSNHHANYVCYLQMEKLELKLASELPSTAKVVTCRFPFPTWIPESTAGEGIDTVWVYDAKTFKSHL